MQQCQLVIVVLLMQTFSTPFQPLLVNLPQGACLQGAIPSQAKPGLRTVNPTPDGSQRGEIRLSHQQIGQVGPGQGWEDLIGGITHQKPPGFSTDAS